MQIVPMDEKNLYEVYEIEKNCFSDPWKIDIFKDQLQQNYSYCFVAYVGGQVAGYVMMWCFGDEGEIINIATDPNYRRQGVAKELLAACKKICKKITLEVRLSNVAAIHLYEKHGFKNMGTRKDYYKNPTEDAVIMILGLED